MYALEFAGEDDRFAAAEAASAATGVEVIAPGVATATTVTDRVRNLAYTRRAIEVVGRTDASVASARTLVDAAGLDREGTVAVRARTVRDTAEVDTQRAERALGQALVDRGYAVDLDDPDHELRAVFAGETCVVGWLEAESVRDYGTRKPTDRPFFQPGGMDPLLARALVNVAGARPGATVLDPMCGTGGVLIEAGLAGASAYGADAQRKMARGAARNLDRYLGADDRATGEWATVQGDATHLPFPDGAIDAVVFDAPYGRQSKIANLDLDDLVAGALAEARRVADRAVVVGDRSWASEARDVGWTVEAEFERRVHRSLDRHVVVLDGESGPP
ncbi:methyltransferase domain-containing protein [Halorussus marinus]|uniref:methyltransferase domain-containing protein n=1 Tax=Halorussus marinus TaxID=2505976 RepID=UPI00106EB78F|nr:methyltransferase domain-containing protein [Halorussus marinus]